MACNRRRTSQRFPGVGSADRVEDLLVARAGEQMLGEGVERCNPDWGARLFVTADPHELVGWGVFKGPPREGVVELGYEIAAARQGRGLATAAVRALVAEGFADERVTRVVAHTLPERNASNRVLVKVGFEYDGVAEHRGGVVWRYSVRRPGLGEQVGRRMLRGVAASRFSG